MQVCICGRMAGIPIGLHYSWILIAMLLTMSLLSRFVTTHSDSEHGTSLPLR